MGRRLCLWTLAAGVLVLAATLSRTGEEHRGSAKGPLLLLDVIDKGTGKPTAARFSLLADGRAHYPATVNEHGLRFVSVHEAKRQVHTLTYARGTGTVEVSLPEGVKQVSVRVAKGFEFFPVEVDRAVRGSPVRVRVELTRWADLASEGWTATDAHVHYDRPGREADRDWLTMLAGDGLHHAHFMVLKGGKVPGVWARQYAYGKEGEASDGERWIRPGEEYRDTFQGHINLLGLREVIPPISTGGLGKPPVAEHYPPLIDVFRRCRKLGGFGGVAHGASLGRQPTAVADTALGGVDFFEIANAHLYATDTWYRLMNCGYHLPPAAGTDLPNYPFRDPWQPFLGSMRMYVKVGPRTDFNAWKQAVKRGEVFVSSGPLLAFTVDGKGPGGVIRLPAGGGEIRVEAELSSPVGLRALEMIQNGKALSARVDKERKDGVHRWRIRQRLRITRSCWLAARGEGVPIEALQGRDARKVPWFKADALAHSGVVRVEVGGRPIRSSEDAKGLIRLLQRQQEHYRTRGVYREGADRLRVQELFDRAIAELKKRS